MKRASTPAVFALVALLISTVTRIGLCLFSLYKDGPDSVPLALYPLVFTKGFIFDLAMVAYLMIGVLLYEALLPNRWRAHRIHFYLRQLWLASAFGLLLFGVVSEFTFWLEFSTRLNFIAVDYLLYTKEVIGNIRESYPVGWIFGGLGLVALSLVGLLRPGVQQADQRPYSYRHKLLLIVAAVVLPVASYQLVSVEWMEGSGNAFADELSGNGVFSFAAALRRNELDYDKFYQTIPDDEARQILASQGVPRYTNEHTGRMANRSALNTLMPKPPRSVVLISVESLSASFLGVYGAKQGLTPNLDRLASEGLLFERTYATGTRTVRGLEALSLGTPPIPGQAIVRRPNNHHLSTIGQLLQQQGYASSFVYGGYGYFDNMNAYFAANDYKVIDRTDFPKQSVVFQNVWGVADETLFNQAIVAIDQQFAAQKPSFTHIMTTSNHRPFTYPDGRIDIASPGGREGAVKYTDYAIGKFIDDARSKPWFNETLFVIIADHCASVAGKSKLPVQNYHIPLIMYGPALVKSGRIEQIISQIDVVPTVLNIMQQPSESLYFGTSVFKQSALNQRAFISNYQELGYYKNNTLIVLLPRKRVQAFAIDPSTFDAKPIAVDEVLRKEAVAFYQTASKEFKLGKLQIVK